MTLLLIGTGLFGLLGLTGLCPGVAYLAHYFQTKNTRNKPDSAKSSPFSFSNLKILIPAHNEAELIGTTLTSIEHSIAYFQARPSGYPQLRVEICVGADSCTDNTVQIATQFPMISVIELHDTRNKWVMMKTLVAGVTAEWVLLVDVGTVWPETFLAEFVDLVYSEPKAIAIAPAYRPLKGGWFPQFLWQIESTLKSMETFSGGPVSLHGATMGFQTTCLKKALAYLGDTLWLNDDVVIPLTLRALYPQNTIVYPAGQVRDAGAKHAQLDIGRRKRMVLGNLQWVQGLLPSIFRLNPVAGILAVRRLFRMLWAYWLTALVIGMALMFHSLILPSVMGLATLAILSGSFRQLAGAGLASLLAPFRATHPRWQFGGSWK